MKKTLLISYSLPPSPSGTATVIANICRQFSKDELIISGAKNYGIESVFNWEDPPTIKYTSWRTKPFRGAGIIRLLMLPLTFGLTCYYLRKYNCRSIIAIYPNNEFLILGYLVAKFTNSSFFPYMHNLFVENKDRSPFSKYFLNIIEKSIFKDSHEVLLLSDGLKLFYSKKYGNTIKFKVIRHTYNETIVNYIKPINCSAKTRYVMLGSINESNRDASVRLLSTIYEIYNTELLLRSGTPKIQLKLFGVLDLCTYIPQIDRSLLLEILNSAHALLLPHGFCGKLSKSEYQTIFPTKTIEYLISGRPIIAHCPKNSFLYDFLTQYDCACVITDIDGEVMKKKIIEFMNNFKLQKKIIQNAFLTARLFDAKIVSKELRESLSSTSINNF